MEYCARKVQQIIVRIQRMGERACRMAILKGGRSDEEKGASSGKSKLSAISQYLQFSRQREGFERISSRQKL